MAQARIVYDRLGLDFSASDEAIMKAWVGGNQRDNRPAHEYSLQQFGLTEQGLKDAFAFYRSRMFPGR